MQASSRSPHTDKPATSDLSEPVRVKVTGRAEIFWNGQQVDIQAFDYLLSEMVARRGIVVYYRESPSVAPTSMQLEIFRHIPDSGVMFTTGDRALPEWGQLTWFEMGELPHEFGLSIIPERPVILLDPDCDYVYTARNPSDMVHHLFGHFGFLISAHRLVETEQSRPDIIETLAADREGFMLRFAFDSAVRWASFYEPNMVPDNVRSFYDECRLLLPQYVAAFNGTRLDRDEALQFFENGTLPQDR